MDDERMSGWLAFLERESGHQILCLIVIFVGGLFYKLGIPKGEDLIVLAIGIMSRSMGAEMVRSYRERKRRSENQNSAGEHGEE